MKKKVIMYNIFTAIVILCTSVYAAINANLNLNLESNKIQPGAEFEVTLSLKDLEQITGVDSVEGYINIDENVIENIDFSDIVKDENNQIKIGNQIVTVYDMNQTDSMPEYGVFFNGQPISENDCKIIIDLKEKVTTQDLLKIKFKVKNDVEEKTYDDVIKYEMFTITEGITSHGSNLSGSISIEVSDAVVNVNNTVNNTINNTVNNTTKNTVNTITNNTTKNTVNNTTNNNKNIVNKANNTANKVVNTSKNVVGNNAKDNTLANKILPATGATSIIVKVIAVGLLLGFVVYSKYKKYKNI